jgi:hypothetical protein
MKIKTTKPQVQPETNGLPKDFKRQVAVALAQGAAVGVAGGILAGPVANFAAQYLQDKFYF